MADRSKIEWTDATWNPVSGCSKVSAGCKFCYAERQFPRVYPGRAFTDVRLHPERLEQPLHWKRPRKIFVNSMSDLFHEAVPLQFIEEIWSVMAAARQHTFQILTKRSERMNLAWRAFPIWFKKPLFNVWLGVSIEDQATADERIPFLLRTSAAIRFVSYEPALRPLDFRNSKFEIRQLDWVIAGGESGPQARPSHPDWFRSIRDQLVAARVPFFFKQWGEWGLDQGGCRDRVYVDRDGGYYRNVFPLAREGLARTRPDAVAVQRIGKKRAGRLLDGREWNEFPSATQVGGCGR